MIYYKEKLNFNADALCTIQVTIQESASVIHNLGNLNQETLEKRFKRICK